jgi:hypothetical protein
MQHRTKSENAEVGSSAMIIFIALILVSSIISALIIGVGESVFTRTKSGAQQNIPTFKGITNVVVLEISNLGATDEIHIVFELPYVEASVPEESLAWVLMCVPQNQGGGQNTIHFDEGNFQLATELDGDGLTDLPLVEFEPGVDYRMIIQLDICDLEDTKEATLVLMVDRGRTQELQLNIGSAPYLGQDLI